MWQPEWQLVNTWQRSDRGPEGMLGWAFNMLSPSSGPVHLNNWKGAWAAPMPEPVRKTSQWRMNHPFLYRYANVDFRPIKFRAMWSCDLGRRVQMDKSVICQQEQVLQTHLRFQKPSQEQNIQRQPWLLPEEIHSSMSDFLMTAMKKPYRNTQNNNIR